METIVLDDNKEYMIVEQLEDNTTKYVLFSSIDNSEEFCIRKIKNKNGENYFVRLDSEKEAELITNKFTKLILNDFNK